jgi:hypothetical protein
MRAQPVWRARQVGFSKFGNTGSGKTRTARKTTAIMRAPLIQLKPRRRQRLTAGARVTRLKPGRPKPVPTRTAQHPKHQAAVDRGIGDYLDRRPLDVALDLRLRLAMRFGEGDEGAS